MELFPVRMEESVGNCILKGTFYARDCRLWTHFSNICSSVGKDWFWVGGHLAHGRLWSG